MRDPVAEILAYNRPFVRRDMQRLRDKLTRMARGPFAFFRGTFHLFAKDMLDTTLRPAELLDHQRGEFAIVGDLHSQNYGTYKAADGFIHYDINDFDETTTGPLAFDLCRLAISHVLAAKSRPTHTATDATDAVEAGLAGYIEALKSSFVDLDYRETILSHLQPIVELLHAKAACQRAEFIGRLTQVHKGKRVLIRTPRYFDLPDSERTLAERAFADYVARRADDHRPDDFFQVDDICGRIAGVGSMGRYRYAVLIQGKGSAEARNVLLELKESRTSAYDDARGHDAGDLAQKQRAQMVVTMQRESQAASSGYLGYGIDGNFSFQVREIGPHDDRIEESILKSPALLRALAHGQGAILARVHMRSCSRKGDSAAAASTLGDEIDLRTRLVNFADAYAAQVESDFKQLLAALKALEDPASWK